MPRQLQLVREKRKGLLDQVFEGIAPRRTRESPNFRDGRDDAPRRDPPRQSPPRRAVFRADGTMFQGLGRREPLKRAPSPPRKTAFGARGGSDRQDFDHVKMIGEGGQGRCDLYRRTTDSKLFVYKVMKCPVRAVSNVFRASLTPFVSLRSLGRVFSPTAVETCFMLQSHESRMNADLGIV